LALSEHIFTILPVNNHCYPTVRTVVVGILSLLCACLYGYGFLSGGKGYKAKCKEVRGGVEPRLMARWKARVELLLSVIELLFYLLRLRRYKAKYVKTRCLQEGVGHLEPRFQGEGVVPG